MNITNFLNKLWVYKAWAGNSDYQNYSAVSKVEEENTEPEEASVKNEPKEDPEEIQDNSEETVE